MMKEFEHFADMIKVLINGGEEGFTAENFSAAALGNKFYDNKVMAEKFVEAMHKEGPPDEEEEEEGDN